MIWKEVWKRMMRDIAIDEIREVRRRISARFEHDPKALLDYYRKAEAEFLREREKKGHNKKNNP